MTKSSKILVATRAFDRDLLAMAASGERPRVLISVEALWTSDQNKIENSPPYGTHTKKGRVCAPASTDEQDQQWVRLVPRPESTRMVITIRGCVGGRGDHDRSYPNDPPVSAEFSLFPTGELGIRRIMRAAISPR